METHQKTQIMRTCLGYAVIYFVWGSTFLAIRIGERDIPPFTMAAMRFLIAGMFLCAITLPRGEKLPRPFQWPPLIFLGTTYFVLDYGLLFWAETRVASGVAAVVMALIPVFMMLSEALILRSQRITPRLMTASALGVVGVGILVVRSLGIGGRPIDLWGSVALCVASVTWALGSVFSRKLNLPACKALSSGIQMLIGGALLSIVAFALKEPARIRHISVQGWTALLYLALPGSALAFTVYLWLLARESPTRVATYAYVNPIVAVILGASFGHEALSHRIVAGVCLVLVSVMLIVTTRARGPSPWHAPSLDGRRRGRMDLRV